MEKSLNMLFQFSSHHGKMVRTIAYPPPRLAIFHAHHVRAPPVMTWNLNWWKDVVVADKLTFQHNNAEIWVPQRINLIVYVQGRDPKLFLALQGASGNSLMRTRRGKMENERVDRRNTRSRREFMLGPSKSF